ncbi:hypothetical protein GWN42_08240, partial [candidate division KSB1 bacterium]|nr:hypothetical protein [candidate division KSB1 bacterium]NIV92776.1 hypothetical protein [candidate division KSB1 bacterium]NIW19080.1 hypothetical protein [candidate division KSB1 bacterium]NIW67718.1 hypothetical protein [candidate division KSB1 bacterium]
MSPDSGQAIVGNEDILCCPDGDRGMVTLSESLPGVLARLFVGNPVVGHSGVSEHASIYEAIASALVVDAFEEVDMAPVDGDVDNAAVACGFGIPDVNSLEGGIDGSAITFECGDIFWELEP